MLRQRVRELEILTVIAEALNRPLELQESLGIALSKVSELLSLHTGWVYLLNEGSGLPYLAATQNLPPGLASNPRLMSGGCYCIDTFLAGDLEGAANVNIVGCSRLAGLMGQGSGGLRYHSSIPLECGDRKLGVLNVATADWRELTASELGILRTVGDMIGLAIERARLATIAGRVRTIDECNRLARETHDALTHDLAGIVTRLESLERLLDEDPDIDRAREHLARSCEHARASLERARQSSHDLRAAPLEGRTIVEALEELALRTERESQLEITFETRGAGRRPAARIELGLYQIAQQALAAIIARDTSRNVRILLSMSLNRARLTIDDDGTAFDAGEPHGSQTLVAIAERGNAIGGRIEVAVIPGFGTRLVVAVAG